MQTHNDIREYLNHRYSRYICYASYHCKKAGLSGYAKDITNDVLLNLLQMNDDFLRASYNRIYGKNRELDFYVLREIKRICYLKLSLYRCAFLTVRIFEAENNNP